MAETRIKQSKNWETASIAWIIENAQFAFTNKLHKGNRVRIVTKKKIMGYDCFELDNDQHGAIITSMMEYKHDFWQKEIIEFKTHKSKIIEMIDIFYHNWGAIDIVNPKPTLKLFWSILRGNCKIVSIKHRI